MPSRGTHRDRKARPGVGATPDGCEAPASARLMDGWVLHYFLLLAIGIVVVFIAALPVGKILEYRRDAHRMIAEAERLREEARVVRQRAQEARRPVNVERIARERLSLSFPGEIVFVPVEGPWPEPSSPKTKAPARSVRPTPSPVRVRPTPTASPTPSYRPRTSPTPGAARQSPSPSPRPATSGR